MTDKDLIQEWRNTTDSVRCQCGSRYSSDLKFCPSCKFEYYKQVRYSKDENDKMLGRKKTDIDGKLLWNKLNFNI